MDREFIKLVLDLATFEESNFSTELNECFAQGFEFTTMNELGDTEENRFHLYELNKLCSRDIPGRGEFFSYDEFCQRRYGEYYDPRGVAIGVTEGHWIGMCATSNHSDKGFCFNEMTGVINEYRRRGLALALKFMGIRYAKSVGVQKVFTIQDAQNSSAIAMNRKLGYVDSK